HAETVKATMAIDGATHGIWPLAPSWYPRRRIDSILSRRHSENMGAPGPGRTVMAILDFETMARELRASDVYVGLPTGADGMIVWIGDRYARLRKDMVIDFDRETGTWDLDETASEWIHGMALKLFPDTLYARLHRRPRTRRRQ